MKVILIMGGIVNEYRYRGLSMLKSKILRYSRKTGKVPEPGEPKYPETVYRVTVYGHTSIHCACHNYWTNVIVITCTISRRISASCNSDLTSFNIETISQQNSISSSDGSTKPLISVKPYIFPSFTAELKKCTSRASIILKS